MQKDELLYERWDRYWSEPRLTLLGRIMIQVRLKILKEIIHSLAIKTAIDVGCGFGHTLQLLYNADLDYIGIDVSNNAIAFCKNKGLKVRLGKIEDEMRQYDLVISEGMLEHFFNFEPYAQHLMRISNRYVLLIQPNHDSFSGKTLVYFAQIIRGKKLVFEYNYQIKDYITVFNNNGFKVTRNISICFDTSKLLLFEKTVGQALI